MRAPTAALVDLPKPAQQVDRYQVIAEVAHGGMAAVYAVRQSGLSVSKVLAMKVLLPHLASDERFADMFLDEARIAAQIQHPNVVQMFEVGSHHGRKFMVMEYLRGQSFSHVLRQAWMDDDATMPEALVLWIAAEAARGLHAAHEARGLDGQALGVVHRDVSPQNIHVGYDGQIKVIDFGIAAAAGRATSTRTGEVKGKLAYMAPEQIHRRTELDRRTDVWAVGVMLWQTFAKRTLFRGHTDAETMFNVLNQEPPDIQSVAPHVPDALASCIMACLSREPSKRPPSAAAVARVLSAAAVEAGGADQDATADFMQRTFAEELAAEADVLSAAATDAHLALAEPRRGGPAEASLSKQSRAERKPLPLWRRPWPYALGLGSLTVAVVIVILGYGGTVEPSIEAAATIEPEARPPLAAAAEAVPEPPTSPVRRQRVRIAVSPAIDTVLVDDRLHEERPLSLLLVPDERVQVVLVGPGGQETRSIGVEAHGTRLALAESRPENRPESESESRGDDRTTPSRRPRRPVNMTTRPRMQQAQRVEARGTGLLPVDL
ncbi:MAG: serine/threonine-protein kinase [Myxococcota bacterium]